MNENPLIPNTQADKNLGLPEADTNISVPLDGLEWHSRGYLPHRDRTHLLQSITFRLADSLPQTVLQQLEAEIRLLPKPHQNIAKRKSIEQWLDAGMGCCALRNAEAAAYVQKSLLHFDGDRYHVIAWVVMPNHVHVLIDPVQPIAKIVQGWKSFTARWLLAQNEQLGLKIRTDTPSSKVSETQWD